MPVTIANEGVVRIEAGGVVVINDDTTETEAPTNMHTGLQWSLDARKQVGIEQNGYVKYWQSSGAMTAPRFTVPYSMPATDNIILGHDHVRWTRYNAAPLVYTGMDASSTLWNKTVYLVVSFNYGGWQSLLHRGLGNGSDPTPGNCRLYAQPTGSPNIKKGVLFFRFVTDEGVQEVGGPVNGLTTMSGPHIIVFHIGQSTQLCKFDNVHVPESPRRNLNIQQVGMVSPLALGYDFLGQIYQMRVFAGEHTEYTISQISTELMALASTST